MNHRYFPLPGTLTASVSRALYCGLALCLLLLSACSADERDTSYSDASNEQVEELPANLREVLWLPAMNVFRRHSAPSAEMFHFYGEVLGFEHLGTFDVGNGGVSRFQIGPQELKLTGRVEGRDYVEGGIHQATGLRLLTFFFPDHRELEQRFSDHGLPVPTFESMAGSNRRSAIIQDPDGQWLQLIAAPDREPAFYQQLEIGLTVSDLDASQRFYSNFVGLQPQRPVEDPVFNTMKHSFRHGSTIISLRSFGSTLPADTGSGGIQYVVSDVHAVETLANTMNITIDQPLQALEGFDLVTIWLDDPDGITNYFARTGESARQ